MTRAQGVDVSRYQITTPPLVGRDFLIARATFGLGIDTMYREHIANARKAGLVVGAYAFTYDYISAEQQADAFLKAAGDVDLYFVDVEGKDAQKPAQVQDFIDRVRSKGKRCGLYMSESGFYTTVSTDYRWVANWSHEPKIPWRFWQKRGSPLDLDEYNGTAAELRAFVGIPTAPESDIDMKLTTVKGEDWKAADTVRLFSEPDAASPSPGTIPAGTVLRTIAEATGNDGGSWRLTEWQGAPAWFRYRNPAGDVGDMKPLVQGGDPAVDAALTDYIARKAPDCSAAVKAATDPLKAQLAAEMARANAAESRVANAKTALGCA